MSTDEETPETAEPDEMNARIRNPRTPTAEPVRARLFGPSQPEAEGEQS